MYKKYVVEDGNFYKVGGCLGCMLYRNPDHDPSDVEASIQRYYTHEYEKEQAEKFAKFGVFGDIVHSLVYPNYEPLEDRGDSKIDALLNKFESWDFLQLGKFK